MKAFKAIYSHGHFIDIETSQRLIPVQDAEYTITAADKAFKTEDAKFSIGDTLNSKNKEAWALREFGKDKYGKIMNEGEQLFFRVGNSKRVPGDEDRQYIFVCNLLEDLYLYLLKGRKGDFAEDWRLADCKCALEKCLLGGLALSEKVPAKSLNSLFSNTVQFYFSMQRSGSANSFDTFFLYKDDMKLTFDSANIKINKGLAFLRNEFVTKKNEFV